MSGGPSVQAHRTMCILAHGCPPTKAHEAAHSCGNGHKACVNPHHLRWATPSENCQEKKEHGTEVLGSKKWNSILREEDIPDIRSLYGDDTAVNVGAFYGVDAETIRDVWHGRTWSWLK